MIHVPGNLSRSGGETNERVVMRQRRQGWYEGRKDISLTIEFSAFCFAKSGTHLTAYATLITFRQLVI